MSLTPTQIEHIADAYARGEKLEWIAEHFNTSTSRVGRIARASGLRRRGRRTLQIVPEKAAAIAADYRAGVSINRIRANYTVSTYAIREIIRRVGVDPRPRGHPPGPLSQTQP